MAQVVAKSSSKLSDADLQAVTSWLKDQPAAKEAALAGAPTAQSINPTSVTRVVLAGAHMATDRATTAPAMPGLVWLLGDHETAAVLTYNRNTGGMLVGKSRPMMLRHAVKHWQKTSTDRPRSMRNAGDPILLRLIRCAKRTETRNCVIM